MSAELRLSLNDIDAAKLDQVRGPATRTAYATHLLKGAIERQIQAALRAAQAEALAAENKSSEGAE